MAALFSYNLKELQRRIDEYFYDCDQIGRKYTVHGLCAALGIGTGDYQRALRQDQAGQPQFRARLARAHLRICDELEQRADSMAVLCAKQPIYCGHGKAQPEREAEQKPGILVELILNGMPQGLHPGD